MKTQILFVVAAFVYVSADSQFFCGRKLANTLAVLCPYEAASKRSGADYEALGGSGADYEALGRSGADYEGIGRSGAAYEALGRSGADYEALGRSGADYEALGYTGDDYEGLGRSWLRAPAEALAAKPKRGGVVAECCEKPCSIDELLTYC